MCDQEMHIAALAKVLGQQCRKPYGTARPVGAQRRVAAFRIVDDLGFLPGVQPQLKGAGRSKEISDQHGLQHGHCALPLGF